MYSKSHIKLFIILYYLKKLKIKQLITIQIIFLIIIRSRDKKMENPFLIFDLLISVTFSFALF